MIHTITFDGAGKALHAEFYSEMPQALAAGETVCTPEQYQSWGAQKLSGGHIVTDPDAAAAALAAANSAEAKALLDSSDITILRCAEHGVAVPAAWSAYRGALRAIVSSGSVPQDGWPSRPAFPAGT